MLIGGILLMGWPYLRPMTLEPLRYNRIAPVSPADPWLAPAHPWQKRCSVAEGSDALPSPSSFMALLHATDALYSWATKLLMPRPVAVLIPGRTHRFAAGDGCRSPRRQG